MYCEVFHIIMVLSLNLSSEKTMTDFHLVASGCREKEEVRQWESDLAHGLRVDEVLVAPDAGVIVVLPLHVDVEVGEVVTLWH